MPNYILPPPLGIANDLYEAYPQGPGTRHFSLPDTLIPGNSNDQPGVTTNLNGSTLGSGISGSTISSVTGSALPNSTISSPSSNPQNATTTAGLSPGSLADYFARAIVIVLGFIFIAVGLNMLRPGLVPMPGKRR